MIETPPDIKAAIEASKQQDRLDVEARAAEHITNVLEMADRAEAAGMAEFAEGQRVLAEELRQQYPHEPRHMPTTNTANKWASRKIGGLQH